MKKIVGLFITVCILFACFAGCGPKKNAFVGTWYSEEGSEGVIMLKEDGSYQGSGLFAEGQYTINEKGIELVGSQDGVTNLLVKKIGDSPALVWYKDNYSIIFFSSKEKLEAASEGGKDSMQILLEHELPGVWLEVIDHKILKADNEKLGLFSDKDTPAVDMMIFGEDNSFYSSFSNKERVYEVINGYQVGTGVIGSSVLDHTMQLIYNADDGSLEATYPFKYVRVNIVKGITSKDLIGTWESSIKENGDKVVFTSDSFTLESNKNENITHSYTFDGETITYGDNEQRKLYMVDYEGNHGFVFISTNGLMTLYYEKVK